MTPFETAMDFVAQWEWGHREDGALTDDPKDPGGLTKFGVAQRAHPDVDVASLTLSQALEIYHREYWTVLNADSLDLGMAIAAMDSTVNCGMSRTQEWLRICSTWQSLCNARSMYYLSLKMPRFEKGWLNRMNDLKKYITIVEQNAKINT